jgi:hypothetical protein
MGSGSRQGERIAHGNVKAEVEQGPEVSFGVDAGEGGVVLCEL